jgi:prefoldin subunit 5
MGLNAVRQSNGTWLSANNGTKNGGSVIYGDLNGSINFATIASTGSGDHTYANSDVSSKTMVKFGTSCFLSVGSNNPPSGCTAYFKGWKSIFESTVSSKGTFNIDLSNISPRIFNTYSTTAIVLYSSSSSQFQDLELRTLYYHGQLTQLKSTVNSITDALNKVNALHGKINNNNEDGYSSTYIDASELEQEMPELVKTIDSNQTKLVNYIGIIPYLVEAIKSQQQTIQAQQTHMNTMETDLANCCATGSVIKSDNKTGDNTNTLKTTSAQSAYLLQNTPNPFNTKTTIRYYIPEQTNNASLLIFDMQGKLIKTYLINNKKDGSTEINGGEMQPGMYMYSLIIDGKEIDTKRMILTE